VFPNDGFFKIGPVSGYMLGLWTIPIFSIIYLGFILMENYKLKYVVIFTSVLSLLIFGISEMSIWMIGSWYPQNVTTLFGHLAIYIIIPEVILGSSSFLIYKFIEKKHLLINIIFAFFIMIFYLGNSCFFYLLFEKIIFFN
jgi:hypothetical protein